MHMYVCVFFLCTCVHECVCVCVWVGVQALGAKVTSIEAFVVNVIANAADVDSESELYTLEDGLDLWLAVARNLPQPSAPLLALFPLLSKVLL